MCVCVYVYVYVYIYVYVCVYVCVCVYIYIYIYIYLGFSGGSVVKNLPANAGDAGLTLGSGRSPGEGNGNPL